MLSELDFAKRKLESYLEVLPYRIKTLREDGASQTEIDWEIDHLLDLINQTKRRIEKLERKK